MEKIELLTDLGKFSSLSLRVFIVHLSLAHSRALLAACSSFSLAQLICARCRPRVHRSPQLSSFARAVGRMFIVLLSLAHSRALWAACSSFSLAQPIRARCRPRVYRSPQLSSFVRAVGRVLIVLLSLAHSRALSAVCLSQPHFINSIFRLERFNFWSCLRSTKMSTLTTWKLVLHQVPALTDFNR